MRQSPNPANETVTRLPFIDFGRGLVMVLMAWDHVSAFWNPGRRANEGLMGMQPTFPSLAQFLLRFVTHFVAPTFIFLAGTSLALSAARRLARGQSQADLSLHMVVRGMVLLAFEALLVAPVFDLPRLYFGVIACIGVCLVLFSALRFLPPSVILALSVAIILGHPLLNLDFIPDGRTAPLGHYLHVVIHEPRFDFYPYVGLYPVIPWLGVMGLGWCFGIFLHRFDWSQSRRLALGLAGTGGVLYAAWFVVRLLNGYGNLLPRRGSALVDWLYVSKYPPSPAFLLFTLGGMCFILALGVALQDRPGFKRGLMGAIATMGRVPLFFYLSHLWLYKVAPRPFAGLFDVRLLATAIFWATGLAILWQLCALYGELKRRHPGSVLRYV
jgi:uncharacterized membrane protein